MTQSDILRNELLKEIKDIPEDYIQEILDFTKFIIEKRKHLERAENKDIDRNLWYEFIGGVENGDLARNIDKELYE